MCLQFNYFTTIHYNNKTVFIFYVNAEILVQRGQYGGGKPQYPQGTHVLRWRTKIVPSCIVHPHPILRSGHMVSALTS
jgi:hypothetical protein